MQLRVACRVPLTNVKKVLSIFLNDFLKHAVNIIFKLNNLTWKKV